MDDFNYLLNVVSPRYFTPGRQPLDLRLLLIKHIFWLGYVGIFLTKTLLSQKFDYFGVVCQTSQQVIYLLRQTGYLRFTQLMYNTMRCSSGFRHLATLHLWRSHLEGWVSICHVFWSLSWFCIYFFTNCFPLSFLLWCEFVSLCNCLLVRCIWVLLVWPQMKASRWRIRMESSTNY